VAIVTLALGIGANTAVFTVINGVLLRPLPYADPDRLVTLLNGRNGRLSTAFSPPNYLDITTQSGVFAGSAAFQPTTANLTGHGDPQRLEGADVTWTFFQVLGVTPRLGRRLSRRITPTTRRSSSSATVSGVSSAPPPTSSIASSRWTACRSR
jgi:putative ABC transport system permease protein